MVIALARTLDQTAEELRAQHVLVRTYIVLPHHTFSPCSWCEYTPGEAILTWWWNRPECTTEGYADTCINVSCIEAAMSCALEDSAPEDITVEFPVVAQREYTLAAA